jgi:hypothetical protein
LARQFEARANSLAALSAGIRMAISTAMTAITTSSSISVKARFLKISNLLLMSGEGLCKIDVRHILFKRICFLIFLNNRLTDY